MHLWGLDRCCYNELVRLRAFHFQLENLSSLTWDFTIDAFFGMDQYVCPRFAMPGKYD